MERVAALQIKEDLQSKMVFLGGPRQVGKTTLAVTFLPTQSKEDPGYLTWDSRIDRLILQKEQLPLQHKLLVLDEVHKYKHWRNLVKGYFDKLFPKINFLVTGSARLDLYRHGGDSLHGRYFYHRLHPLSLCEINKNPTPSDLRDLLNFGGFPEPFLKGSKSFLARWQKSRIDRIFQEDIRDLESVKDLACLELLFDALPERQTSPISLRSIARDLEVSHDSVSHWLDIFERMYLIFRVSPYGGPKIRAVKKEQKLYFWDWTHASDEGTRFENLVAQQLLKYCHHLEDTEGAKMELRYLRDIDGREVDFVVLSKRQPLFAVECKTGNKKVSPSCSYYRLRTQIPRFYQVHLGTEDFGDENSGTRVLPFTKFCVELGMP